VQNLELKKATGDGADVAIFYHRDGERVSEPGLIVLGKVKAGIEALEVSGVMEATIELASNCVKRD
jgi:hypothetical protein